jgi:hypothetical protein
MSRESEYIESLDKVELPFEAEETTRSKADEPIEGILVSQINTPQKEWARGRPQGAIEPRKEYCSSIEQDRADQGLFNVQEPRWARNKEKMVDRVAAFMHLEGMSNKEIADHLGVHPLTISNTLRQPWVQDLMVQEAKKLGRDAVKRLIEESALKSVEVLIEVRDSDKANLDTRRKAANDLLDRVYGKPNQPITHREEVNLDSLSDEELAKIVTSGRKN